MPTLDWLNRAQALTTAARVPYRLLEEVSVHRAAIRPGPAQAELEELAKALATAPAGSAASATHGHLLRQIAWTWLRKLALPCRLKAL